MTKGELKKRLIDQLNNLTFSVTLKPNCEDWHNISIPVTFQGYPEKFLDKVLDEAKKDFPATAIYNKYWADYDLNPKKDLTPPELIEEIAKWYLKWFGDSQ